MCAYFWSLWGLADARTIRFSRAEATEFVAMACSVPLFDAPDSSNNVTNKERFYIPWPETRQEQRERWARHPSAVDSTYEKLIQLVMDPADDVVARVDTRLIADDDEPESHRAEDGRCYEDLFYIWSFLYWLGQP